MLPATVGLIRLSDQVVVGLLRSSVVVVVVVSNGVWIVSQSNHVVVGVMVMCRCSCG